MYRFYIFWCNEKYEIYYYVESCAVLALYIHMERLGNISLEDYIILRGRY